MKKALYLWLITTLFCCYEKKEQPSESKLFAEGVISTEAPEFATSVNTAQNEIYFNRTTADRSRMQIMYSVFENNTWKSPTPLPFSTGEYRDVDPFLTRDGNRLYFSSNRPTATDSNDVFNTWYIERQGEGWSEPINPGPPLNSDSTEIFVSIAKSGNAYFVSERDGLRGIKVSRFENGQYQKTERVVLKLRGEPIYASNPCIASDESFLIVAVRDPEGSGRPDLFVTWNQEGTWSELLNLGEAVNSPYAEFAPGLSKDDRILYFSSERPGIVPEQEEGIRPPGDIYKVELTPILARLRK